MLQVKFKKLHADAKLPVKGSSSAACFDVYATSVEVDENRVATYKLGFSTEIPEGWRGVVVPRSNISKHPWVLANSIGIIDSDYRGEWMVKFKCVSNFLEAVPYGAGDRIAQIYFEKNEDVQFIEVEELDQTERGAGGFGSTGISNLTTNISDGKINITA
ncbi:MAG: dUTP diphosphatase [Alphaproteobacteria bacterium]|nr:dUTP diphosphatase [Alphaproteobacteria bacterium]